MLKKTPEVGEYVAYRGGSEYFDKYLEEGKYLRVMSSHPEETWFLVDNPDGSELVVDKFEDDYEYFELVVESVFNTPEPEQKKPTDTITEILDKITSGTIQIKNKKQLKTHEVKAGQVRCNDHGEFVLIVDSGKTDDNGISNGRFNAIVIDDDGGFYPHYHHEIDADWKMIKSDYPILCESKIEIW